MSVLKLEHVSYAYEKKGKPVLDNVSFEFEKGKVYAVTGRSGAGKTTLLSLISGLAVPVSGTVSMNGKNISEINQYDYRCHDIGVIFQNFNLLPKLTAAENVMLSMEISGYACQNRKEHAIQLLEEVGLDKDEAQRRILKLSGGQQQRVAIARALSYDPPIIVADEPTGNLDAETQDSIMDIFVRLAHEENRCVILVTHSKEVAQRADCIYGL